MKLLNEDALEKKHQEDAAKKTNAETVKTKDGDKPRGGIQINLSDLVLGREK